MPAVPEREKCHHNRMTRHAFKQVFPRRIFTGVAVGIMHHRYAQFTVGDSLPDSSPGVATARQQEFDAGRSTLRPPLRFRADG